MTGFMLFAVTGLFGWFIGPLLCGCVCPQCNGIRAFWKSAARPARDKE